MDRINPFANGDNAPYWEAAAEGRLIFQSCEACGAIQFPPRHHCASCWAEASGWLEASGLGTIESVTIVRRAPTAAFRDKAPYAVVAVKTDEGPRMITNLVGADALDARIGDRVEVVFETGADGTVLPQFRRCG